MWWSALKLRGRWRAGVCDVNVCSAELGICSGLKWQQRSFDQNIYPMIQMVRPITLSDIHLAFAFLCLSFPLILIIHDCSFNVLCWIIALNFDQRKLVHREDMFHFENWWKLSIFHIICFWFQFMDGSRSVVHRNSAVSTGNTLLLILAFGISLEGWNWTKNS